MKSNPLSEQAVKALTELDQLKCGVRDGKSEAITSTRKLLHSAVDEGDREILWFMLSGLTCVAEADIELTKVGGKNDAG